MSMSRSFGLSLLLAAGLFVTGCQTTESTAVQDGDDAEAQAQLSESEGRPPHGRMRGHGPGDIFFVALEVLDLTPEERATIENLANDLRPPAPPEGKHGPSDEQRKALADAVRAGKVDATKFAEDAPPAPPADMHEKLVGAIQKLHDMLTPEERTKLVAALDARAPEGPPPGERPDGPPPGEHPHARGERGERHEGGPPPGGRMGPAGPGGEHAGPPMGGPPIEHMLDDLGVSDAQKTRILAALDAAGLGKPPAPPEDHADRRRAFGEAFVKDGFRAADDLPAPPAFKARPSHAAVLAIIVPELDDAQRAKLAERIEQGPPERPARPQKER